MTRGLGGGARGCKWGEARGGLLREVNIAAGFGPSRVTASRAYHPPPTALQRPEEGIWPPGTGVVGGHESSCGSGELVCGS
ncbi:rCG28982 [Rattus norvegicus]|uniref:RCG28982 n=1 Tax=Rattus norvegicus TaxID=10116 RepID=A6HUZ8_RAT|nr:rCG28982 [Rattus norvegicus]